MQAVDKANGYCFGDSEQRSLQALMSTALGADFQFTSYPFHTFPLWFAFSPPSSEVESYVFVSGINHPTGGVGGGIEKSACLSLCYYFERAADQG